ncbi:MAG: PolC-type DNA polymerase III [Tissierellia bacterium]|nr:PolC-type DNA polymerase III [Tissierellia bacterium]
MKFIDLISEVNRKYETKLVLDKVSFFKGENKIIIDMNDMRISDKMTQISSYIKEKLKDLNTSIEIRVLDFETVFDKFKSGIEINIDIDTSLLESNRKCVFILNDLMFKDVLNQSPNFEKVLDFLKSLDIEIDYREEKSEEFENAIRIIEERKENQIQKQVVKASSSVSESREKLFTYGFLKDIPKEITSIENIVENHKVKIKGTVYEYEQRTVKIGTVISFDLDDGSYAVRCKTIVRENDLKSFEEFRNGMVVEVSGLYKYDDYEKTSLLSVFTIVESKLENKKDEAKLKRIEFNIHSKYSMLEGLVDVQDLVNTLKSWEHNSFGITDLYNVQAYPEIYNKAKKAGIKLNLGMDAKLLDSELSILTNYYDLSLSDKDIVVFDIETTGLSKFNDRITEIGAVKIRNGKIIDEYQELVNPERPLSQFIIDLTGITNEMLSDKRKIREILPEFLDFCKDCLLSAHNSEFDMGFIIENARQLGIDFKPIYFDTLYLARGLNPNLKNHKLDTLSKHYQVKLLNHHRASDDARATAMVLIKMFEELEKKNIKFDENINSIPTEYPLSKNNRQYGILLVQNKVGLKNLYTIVSKSSLEHLSFTPGVPFSLLEKYREGILVGTGNYNSKLFDLISLGYPYEIYSKVAEKFDFLRVTPKDFSNYLISENYIRDEIHLQEINKKIIELGENLNKLVVATGDVYYIEPQDYVYKNILTNYPRKRFTENSGCFYLKTTEEMLENFDYLPEDERFEVVVNNTHKLDELIENISPIADGTFPPEIENADKILTDTAFKRAREIYGENLPEEVESRLKRELDSIIGNGYATLYIIAQKLVRKSNDDGYLVGSRGSVGSSFAATMADITEVNPLSPHYVCPKCKNSDFKVPKEFATGVDLPDKNCPKCGSKYNKDGYDIPFEVFLGFEGDKEPDIDLNFASVYQAKIHKYTETLFGNKKVFRAGTLGTIAEKTAIGMARKYKEFYPEDDKVRLDYANLNRVKRKIVGVKRTTGQHAGGLIIVPDDKDIEDFTPVQYPADQANTGIITTHFDYHAIDTNLLKLDLLGHNAPTIVRMLSDQSGIDAISIDLSDKDTMSIFNNTDKLNIVHDYTNIKSGSLGIPEFGTGFVREMLKDTKPTTFGELVRISGLSHGTDVWLNNAQTLISDGTCTLKEAICTRDDIMNYLIAKKLPSKHAFDIMEQVRKGKGLKDIDIEVMKEKKVPQWYIDSCIKIKYMFPKAHAVAYVMMAYRIAFYKVHHPEYFYSTYFTNKIADFQYSPIANGLEFLTSYIKEYMKSEGFERDDKFYCLELGEEMLARDIKMLKVDLYKSHPENFTVPEKGAILPPLMAVENVSQAIANSIADAREQGEFISVEDFKSRTKINKTALQSLENAGLLNGMQITNQIDFFSM